MICAGVTYIGVGSLKAQKWAKSSSWAQKLAFDQSKPLDGTDDTDNWYTSSVKFDGIWQAYRWLPKEQLQVEWYKDICRFSYLDSTTRVHIY